MIIPTESIRNHLFYHLKQLKKKVKCEVVEKIVFKELRVIISRGGFSWNDNAVI